MEELVYILIGMMIGVCIGFAITITDTTSLIDREALVRYVRAFESAVEDPGDIVNNNPDASEAWKNLSQELKDMIINE